MITVLLSLVFMSLNISVKSFDENNNIQGALFKSLLLLSEFEDRNATSICEAHMQEYLKGLKSKSEWALRMIDSTGKIPIGILKGNTKFFGVFDECLSIENSNKTFTGKYCPVLLKNHDKDFLETFADYGLANLDNFPTTTKVFLEYLFGVCIPSSCSATEIQAALINIINSTLGNITKIIMKDKYCTTNEPIEISKTGRIVFGILAGFLLITILSTIYDLIYIKYRRKSNLLLSSFSLITNWKLLLSEPMNPDEIKPLHGIRALAICWIVMGHSVIYPLRGPTMNFLDQPKIMENPNFAPVISAYFNVDTFFFLSGFLSYLSFRRSIIHRGSYDAPMAYIYRYIRLTPPLVIVLMIQATIFKYFGNGPLWNIIIQSVQADCPDMWLYSLTYVQNYMKPWSSCLGQAWYLSTDMQLYWISPLILFPLQFLPKFASVLIVFLILASVLSSFIMTYLNNYGPTILITSDPEGQFKYEFASISSRITPWLIGVVLSYIIYTIRDKRIKINLSKFCVGIFWLMALGFILGPVYGIAAFTDFDYTPLESAFLESLGKTSWVVGLSWIIFACEHGYGGFINMFLSHRIFVPFSRLSYAVYLLHVPVQLYSFSITRTNFYQEFWTLLYFYLGDLVITFLLAVPLKLIFELPFGIIDKILLQNLAILPLPRRNVHVITNPKKAKIEIQGSGKMEIGKINNSFENDSGRL